MPKVFRRIFALAQTTYRETARDYVPLALFGVGLAAGLASLIISEMSLGRDPADVVASLTTSLLSLSALVVSVVLGTTLLHKDLDRKTLFALLARPVRRWEVLVGKHLGLFATVVTFALANSALALALIAATQSSATLYRTGPTWILWGVGLFLAMLRMRDRSAPLLGFSALLLVAQIVLVGPLGGLRALVLTSLLLALVESLIVLAIALFFGSFTNPALGAVFTVGIVWIGRSADMLAHFPRQYGEVGVAVGKALSHVLPNLQLFVPNRTLMTEGAAEITRFLGYATAYGVVYTCALLLLGALVFSRREFV